MIIAALLFSSLGGLLASDSVLWNEDNCNLQGVNDDVVYGTPTDAICCNNIFTDIFQNSTTNSVNSLHPVWNECSKLDSADKCDMNDRCLWVSNGAEGVCRENRDAVNNVCCRPGEIMENCQALLNGKCPSGWAVPTECCPPPYDKYAGRLDTESEDTVCCNAPCTAIELAFNGNATQGIVANTVFGVDGINEGLHSGVCHSGCLAEHEVLQAHGVRGSQEHLWRQTHSS